MVCFLFCQIICYETVCQQRLYVAYIQVNSDYKSVQHFLCAYLSHIFKCELIFRNKACIKCADSRIYKLQVNSRLWLIFTISLGFPFCAVIFYNFVKHFTMLVVDGFQHDRHLSNCINIMLLIGVFGMNEHYRNLKITEMANFAHLHVHTQYSLLDGASKIPALIGRVKDLGMSAVAITDHGNMFGVKLFHDNAKKQGIKPIIGCEAYVARRSRHQKDDQFDRGGYHLVILAKNKAGYDNLIKLVSMSWTEGHYYRPRIDKEILWKYGDGLIISSACLGGEIPKLIMAGKLDEAEKVVLEFKQRFGEDYYLEIMDHGMSEQKEVNTAVLELAKKTGVKVIATNDLHFVNADDAPAHDILVCLSTGKDYDDPNRMRYTGQEFVKSEKEMRQIFPQAPEAISNTMEIADKVEVYELNRDILLPEFPMPEQFTSQDDYLRHLTYDGAKAPHRYPEMTDAIRERIDYELKIIKDMGFAGYFLIVQDFINAAREMDVSVGPGRGSAAGSAVAFATGITNVDPIKYKLLFERFLNPERVSMPDIDIDFDEDGREDVMKWVVNKYGRDKVAAIITFGTMAAKMSIKDVARVLQMPLHEANRVAKLIPDKPGTTLAKALKEVPELKDEKEKGEDLVRKTLRFAEILEGSVRQTGVHACGVIIAPDSLENYIPISANKDQELYITQYDGKHIENVGMLKMDFLGLKTLSIIKEAIDNVKLSKGIEILPDDIPLDDKTTFELYQRGDTVGTFQFESNGMRTYLRELKPTCLEDLFAMNALYRPGPMDFIPLFIKRKQGLEKVEYPHAMLEPILKDTYGIMIYQEQIMQAAQIMAGFSLGSADVLRRAMGKKKMDVMAQQKEVFVEGALKKNVEKKNAQDVFSVMEKFASYGFNRSHSAAYSIVAFQTAYLKANHPAEYMAAVLSRNFSDISKITIFMDECRRMALGVYGPDVNESFARFTVNKSGVIRFGMSAIKGVGQAAVDAIVSEREKSGNYKDIFDFVERVNLNAVNRRTLEALALAGAFDGFGLKRSQYFAATGNDAVYIEQISRYGSKFQLDSQQNQNSLFGGTSAIEIQKPTAPECEEWSKLERLGKEKELIGIYLSAHPLDDYKLVINASNIVELSRLTDLKAFNGNEIKAAGIVTSVEHRTAKNGNPFGSLTIEDYRDTYKFMLFGKDYLTYKTYMEEGYSLLIKGKAMPSFRNKEELEFKISSISMLSDLGDNVLKSIAIKVPIESVTEDFLTEIMTHAKQHSGKAILKFLVYEPATKVWVQMFSRSMKITITTELIEYLETAQGIDYKID